VDNEPSEKQLISSLLSSVVWNTIRVIIFVLLLVFFMLPIFFILFPFPETFSGPLKGLLMGIAIVAGVGAIVFEPSWLISSKHMRIWAPLSFFLGAFISFSLLRSSFPHFSLHTTIDALMLLWIIAGMTMEVFGIGIIAFILFDILYPAIKPIKVSKPALTVEEMQKERASIRQYRIMSLFTVILFLFLMFISVFLPPTPPPESPFAPREHAQQTSIYPIFVVLGILFGLFLTFFFSFAALNYHLKRGNPIVIRKRDFLLDASVFCSISVSSFLLSPFAEKYLHTDLLLPCFFCILYYTIKRYPWIIQVLGASPRRDK